MPYAASAPPIAPGGAVPHRKWLVRCGDVELKITLTDKWLAKPLADALIEPFLGAYAKKMGAHLTSGDVARVLANGLP
eukprot:6658460-Prymnesium_polylepis.2